MSGQVARASVLVAAFAWALAARALAAPPEQFGAWGSAGPDLPPAPNGWREAPPGDAEVDWPASPPDRQRGYILFIREPLSPVSPRASGLPAERAPAELRAFAARGEYEPVSFAVHALAPLSGVRVEVGELKAERGGAIPADHVDVRVVRCVRVQVGGASKTYRLEPFLLEKRPAFDVPAGSTRRVWITIKVPEAAAPGRYQADLRVLPAGRPPATLKLMLDVLPLALPPAAVEMAAFYPRPPDDDAMLRRQLIDMREHGCNAVEPAMSAEVKSRDRDFGDDDVQAVEAHCRRMLRAIRGVFGEWRYPATFSVGHQIACYWDKDRNWFVYWPHEKKIDSDLLKAIDVVRQAAKAEGGPALRAYGLDEAGAHNLLDEAVYYYRLIRRQRSDLATWTSIGGGMAMGVDEIGQLSDVVDVLATNRFTPDIARLLAGRGKPYGVYNGAGPTAAGARFFYGFWGWKTAASEVAQWCYHFGNGVFEGGGIRQEDEGYVYVAPDGPLPSIPWEAAREGIDDYRYVQLLWGLIAAGKASGNAAAKGAAEQAERVLNDVLGRIGWGFQALAGEDRAPPPHPSTLRKWRARLAGEIVKLQAALGDSPAAVAGGIGAKAPPRPPALDMPWPGQAKEQLQYGPELLPAGDFEPGRTPWQVQAWKGKGAGRADEDVRHTGRRSMRVEIPAEAGSDAITVLTWPSWGANKIDISLGGGRTYELSAWVTWRGRSTAPGLRISLPDGAAKATRNGQDPPDPAGWQRLWTRAELNFPVVPKYLAVWVQGPGTVWVDDLSLREAIPPPLRMSLDQDAYDAHDAAGLATIAVDDRLVPAAVRLTLWRRGGGQVAQRTCPFRTNVPLAAGEAKAAAGDTQAPAGIAFLAPVELRRCRVVFAPAALAPGAYDAKVELLDAQSSVLAAEAASFIRLAD